MPGEITSLGSLIAQNKERISKKKIEFELSTLQRLENAYASMNTVLFLLQPKTTRIILPSRAPDQKKVDEEIQNKGQSDPGQQHS